MKKIILILTLFLLANLSVKAQTSIEDKAKLKQINQEVVTKYKEGKFDDALTAAQAALDLTSKIFGAESGETGIIYTNFGEIYLAKKKYDDAAANFQKALSIYRRNPASNADRIARNLESLGIVLVLDGKGKQGEEFLQQSVISAENAFGKEGKALLPYLKSLSDFYIYIKKPESAYPLFVRRFLITSKYFQPESKELEEIEDDFQCYSFQNFKFDEAGERQKQFYEATKDARKNEADKTPKADAPDKSINAGVINGKAKSLPKPEYPASARARFAEGVVPVKVTIDEQGRVVSAKAICGDPDLKIASEESAKKAKFTPTLLSGQPVKVTGTIVYNFIR